MNTQLEYMYRDANNYKTSRTVIFAGELSEKQIQQIKDKCDNSIGETDFVPNQVDLPDLQEELQQYDSEDWDDDLAAHELQEISLTNSEPTEEISAKEFLVKFMSIKKWELEKPVHHILDNKKKK